MGKLKEKKLSKDIEELEELERQSLNKTRDQVLNYVTYEQWYRGNVSSTKPKWDDIYYSPKTSSQVITKLEADAALTAEECVLLLVKKNQDYGPDNINNAPGGALNGLNVRLFDKVSRLNNLLTNKKDPNYESIRDTFVDIVNYGIISILILDNKWESTK